jgi:hypothetical protein
VGRGRRVRRRREDSGEDRRGAILGRCILDVGGSNLRRRCWDPTAETIWGDVDGLADRRPVRICRV